MTFVYRFFRSGTKVIFQGDMCSHVCMHVNFVHIFIRHTCLQAPPKNWAGPGDEANISYARSTRCVAVNYEVPVTLYSVCIWAEKTSLFMSSIFRITNNSFSNKIHNPLCNPQSTLKSRNPLWNPEIHFEIQKSTLKSRNPEIHVKFRNPFWNSKSTWNPVDFEILYAETRRSGPLKLILVSLLSDYKKNAVS